MKKISTSTHVTLVLVHLLITFCAVTICQTIEFQWTKDLPYWMGNIDKTNDGYIVVLSGGIRKLNNLGNEVWSNSTGGQFIQHTNDNGYILCSSDMIDDQVMAILLKLNSAGQKEWEKYYYSSKNDDEYSYSDNAKYVRQTKDSGYIALCESGGGSGMWDWGEDFWVIKTDSHGNFQWGNGIGSDRYCSNEAVTIFQTTDSGYMIAVNRENGELKKVNSSGDDIWYKIYDSRFKHVIQTKDNGYIICGNNENWVDGGGMSHEAFVLKTDQNGNKIWKKTFSNPQDYSIFNHIIQTPDDGFLVVGETIDVIDMENNITTKNGWIVKLDKYGNKVLDYKLNEEISLFDIMAYSADEFIIAGNRYSSNGRIIGGWIGKFVFDTGGALTVPQLINPVNVKIGTGNNLWLDWADVTNASSYIVQIDENSNFSSPRFNKTITGESCCQAENLYYSNKFYWRVKAKNSSGSSDWSETRSFITMLDPSVKVKDNSKYEMSYLQEGDQYYIDRDAIINNIPVNLTNCIWLKTANDDKSNTSNSFIQLKFEKEATVYIAYDHRATDYPAWLVNEYSKTPFTIEVSDKASPLELWEKKVSQGDLVLGGNMASGAVNAKSNYIVLIDIPITILDPVDHKIGTGKNAWLSWFPKGNYITYDLQIDKNINFSTLQSIEDYYGEFYLLKDLEYLTDYYWRIKAHNRPDEEAWSEIFQFKTMKEPLLTINQPDNYVLAYLEEGDQYYIDRDYTITDVPSNLKNLLWIKTANQNADNTDINHITFEIQNECTLYVGFDSRAVSLPTWVTSQFSNTGSNILVSDEAGQMIVWSKTFPKGVYTLGGNMAAGCNGAGSHYIILADIAPVETPVANFSAYPVQGVCPLTVQFSNESAGDITSWMWNFGDGSVSTLENPKHTFSYTDSFTVSLTVNGPGGSDTKQKDNFIITVNPAGVTEIISSTPDEFYLTQNFPNPFNPATTIEFGVPKTGHVDIKIYNMSGQLVETPVSQFFSPGIYKVNWDAAKYPSGVYFYKIQAGEFRDIKKMIFTK
ncbi:T9SS type A sorting domain-containing protein [candidate division KSB1 bacterium]|nr:T9SS type A sorting domain-containing protein [candidate division KSB1 bacterium]